MPFVDRPTHRVHYQVHGADASPPLLLIMGLGLASDAWDSLVPRLAARHRVIVVDNRGTGHSTSGRGWFRIRELADDAAAVLEAVDAQNAAVFGISMGGMIALELALHHPGRLRALVLGCTHAGFWRSRKIDPRTLFDLLVGNVARRRGAARLARVLVSMEHARRDSEGVVAWLGRARPASAWLTLLQLLAISLHAAEDRLHHLRLPTLILTGDQDRLVPVENSYRLASWIPHAELRILHGAGHCFPVEREIETVAALDAFLLGDVTTDA
jgi:pimeloyl-ACP methyl ester carboxylesterase